MSENPSDEAQQKRLLEALIFASPEPLPEAFLRRRLGETVNLHALLAALQDDYAGHGVQLCELGGGWAFRTAPDLAPFLAHITEVKRKLPRAAIETLAIIAYHQPVTRAEVESIRGVQTGRGTLDILLETGWIRPGRRRESPGRPLTWITTPAFLDHFNLASLKDLPGLEEFKSAGLLDARPVLANLTPEAGDDADLLSAMDMEDEEPLLPLNSDSDEEAAAPPNVANA